MQAIELYAREQGAGVDFDIYVIHGWKSQEPETAWLINNINLIIKDAAQNGRGVLLLISPSAAVGFNVDGKVADDDPPVEFDLVGVVGRNVVTPDTLAQMMLRIRHAKQYMIYVGGFDPEHLETDKDVILERQRKELLKTAQLAEFDKHGISSGTEILSLWRISAAYTAWDNLQRKDMLGFTAAHLARAGFNPVLNTDKTPTSFIQEYRLMRERWKAHAEQMKRTIPAVNKDLFEKLRKQGKLTEAHYFGRERDRIEKAAGGRDINQEGIFERFGTPKKRGRIYRAERLNRPLADAQQADREEAIKLPQHRGHYTQEHIFLMAAWQVLLKRDVRDFNQSLELLQDHEFDEADLERLLSYCVEHGFEAACKILGYTCSLDINSPDKGIRRHIAFGLFHALLRACRLQAEGKQHRPTINGKRVSHRTYTIPFDVLLLLEQDLACLEDYRKREQEREREQEAVYKFRDDALTPSEFVDTFEPDLVLDGLDERRRAQMAAVPF